MIPDQCRAARELLGFSQDQVAAKAGLSQRTISLCELGRTQRPKTRAAIRAVLEAAGVEFRTQVEGELGVALRQPSQRGNSEAGERGCIDQPTPQQQTAIGLA